MGDFQGRKSNNNFVLEVGPSQTQAQTTDNFEERKKQVPSQTQVQTTDNFQERKKQVLESISRVRFAPPQQVFSVTSPPRSPAYRQSCCSCCCSPGCKCSWKRIKEFFASIDRRRVTHSFKAGVVLGVTTCIVLRKDVYAGIGKNILWAVLTIITVFECTVGATLIKGLNRGLGTLLAAMLGLLFSNHANTYSRDVEPYIVGSTLFGVATIVSYIRFIPIVKAKFDYGAVMFILTFSLVAVSGFRFPSTEQLVWDRILTVLIGCLACVIVSLFIFPIWAGEDFHNLLINNFEDLASAIEGCTKQYFSDSIEFETFARRNSKMYKGVPSNDPIYKGYMSVIGSKQMEESLANFSGWEPWHCRYGFSYPWAKCLEVGSILRHCAYSVSALHGCVMSEVQPPKALRQIFSRPCTQMCGQVVMILREMADTLKQCKKMHRSKEAMMNALDDAVLELHASIDLLYKGDSSTKSKNAKKEGIDEATLSRTSMYLRRLQTAATSSDISEQRSSTLEDDDLYALLYNGAAEYGLKELTQYLSVTVMVTLLLEIVSRVKPILKAMAELEELADFSERDEILKKSPKFGQYRTDKLIIQHASSNIHPL